MIRIIDERFDNATFIMAGMACLIPVMDGYGLKGVGYLSPLCPPLIGLWLGLLLRDISGRPRTWFLVLVASAAASLAGWLLADDVIRFPTLSMRLTLYALLGYLVPFRNVFTGDNWVCKVTVLALSLVAMAFCSLAYDRLRACLDPASHEEWRAIVFHALHIAIGASTLMAVWWMTECAFSKAGQWLGSRRWFRIASAVPMLLVFAGIVVDIIESGFDWWKVPVLASQPVTVTAVLMLVRAAFKKRTGGPTAPSEAG